jgi:hypothetical protein
MSEHRYSIGETVRGLGRCGRQWDPAPLGRVTEVFASEAGTQMVVRVAWLGTVVEDDMEPKDLAVYDYR